MYLLAKKLSIWLLDQWCFGGVVCVRALSMRSLLSHPSTATNTAWRVAVLVQPRVEIYPVRPLKNLEAITFYRSMIIFVGLEGCSAGTFRI